MTTRAKSSSSSLSGDRAVMDLSARIEQMLAKTDFEIASWTAREQSEAARLLRDILVHLDRERPAKALDSGSVSLLALVEQWRGVEADDARTRGYTEAAVQLQVCANELEASLLVGGCASLRASIRALEAEMRELAQRGEHAHGLTVLSWADTLVRLTREKG